MDEMESQEQVCICASLLYLTRTLCHVLKSTSFDILEREMHQEMINELINKYVSQTRFLYSTLSRFGTELFIQTYMVIY